ncbi:MAG: transporter substrate-binding domain-containing protein, partial [Gammaproteobacteria bacterium]|nr:transporter substrate-binding domain-containing protein [Gammaproteobacteria bacterium]
MSLRATLIVLVSLLLGTCTSKPSLLEQVRITGELRVVTRNSPTTFYYGAEGPAGFEYDLAKAFADYLGVSLNMYSPSGFSEVLPAVAAGRAHFAAAGLSITQSRKQTFMFGPPYQMVTAQLIYRYGNRRPRRVKDLADKKIVI